MNLENLSVNSNHQQTHSPSIILNISIILIWLYSVAIVWMHLPPWSTAGAPVTVWAWRVAPWLVPLLCLYLVVTVYVTRILPLWRALPHRKFCGLLCHPAIQSTVCCTLLSLATMGVACVYLLILNAVTPTIPTWPGPLFTCSLYCDSVVDSCQPIGTVQRNASISSSEAFDWFEQHVFGATVTPILGTVSSDNRTLTLTAGTC